MLMAQPLACLRVTAPCAVAWLSPSKDVQVDTLQLEQPPDEDQVMPAALNIEVAWAWVSLVTAKASVDAATPTPGAKSAVPTRVSVLIAVRTRSRMGSSCWFRWGGRGAGG